MTEPVPDADAAEQQLPATGTDPGPAAEPPAVGDDVPVADALEQAAPAGPAPVRTSTGVPLEADPADTEEQSATVPLDEDEGRA